MNHKKVAPKIFFYLLFFTPFTLALAMQTGQYDTPLPRKVQLIQELTLLNPSHSSYALPSGDQEELLDALYNEEHAASLDRLLTQHPDLPFVTTVEHGYTLLHITAAYGNIRVTQILLEAGVSANSYDKYRRTPLHFAAMHGHNDIVSLLLEAGAKIGAPGQLGKTALHFAAYEGFVDVIQTLITFFRQHISSHENRLRTFINLQDRIGYSSLLCALQASHQQTALVLLQNGASSDVRTYTHATTLHMAASTGCASIIPNLIRASRTPASLVNAQDSSDNTALHSAAYHLILTQDPEPYLELCLHGANESITNDESLAPPDILANAVAQGDLPQAVLDSLQTRLAQLHIPQLSDNAEESSCCCKCWCGLCGRSAARSARVYHAP